MIPIEYLWYIIGAISVPVFIMLFLKALKRNRQDKDRVAMRRKRFDRMMKTSAQAPETSESGNRVNSEASRKSRKQAKYAPAPMPHTATERIERVRPTDTEGGRAPESKPGTARMASEQATDGERGRGPVENPATDRTESTVKPVADQAQEHWLRGVKLPPKREESKHWLENMKSKRSRHWLEYLRR